MKDKREIHDRRHPAHQEPVPPVEPQGDKQQKADAIKGDYRRSVTSGEVRGLLRCGRTWWTAFVGMCRWVTRSTR